MRRSPRLGILLMVISMVQESNAGNPVNYDESKVPVYTLPELLTDGEGRRVESARQWMQHRRGEILALFEEHVYGRSPALPENVRFEVQSVDREALNGLATRKQVSVALLDVEDSPRMNLLIYLPNGAPRPAPAFIGLNFNGNHTIHADPGILISEQWIKHKATPEDQRDGSYDVSRGTRASRWAVEKALARGYALATVFCGDLEPDSDGGWQYGVRGAVGRAEGALDEWGAIGAWAWGLRRALDCFEQDPDVDAARVAVMGHSRLGKTALWAGAQDPRFALAISNDSGCGGAALSRRRFGETVQRINEAFPHWFCGNFKRYDGAEDRLPVDQHMLIALMAPRPVYIASAEQDLWADPRGEFLSGRHADPVYHLFGEQGIETDAFPEVNRPVGRRIRYHIRTGTHDVTDYDWEQYLDFADEQLKGNPNS